MGYDEFNHREDHTSKLTRDQAFLVKLTGLVTENLEDEQFGVEDLATAMNMNRTRVYRKVKRLTGKTVSQLIREIRLNKAMDLLGQDVATASEISYQVGFGSPTYFNKCFHDYFGIPPGEVKRRIQEEKLHSENESTEKSWIGNVPVQDVKLNKLKNLKFYYLIAGTMAIIIAFLIIWKYYGIKQIPDSPQSIAILPDSAQSIAILPIKSLSDDPEKQYLADGVMNAIVAHLTRIKELRVIAGISMEPYRDKPKDIREIGKEVGVNYLIESSFQLDGDKARLIIQLADARDGSQIWSYQYDREWSDIFEVQSEVAQNIAREIKLALTPEEKHTLETMPTFNISAYDYYLRGEDYRSRRSMEEGGVEEDFRYAIQMYDHAIEIDSNFTLAWVGLAACSRWIYWLYYDKSEEQLQRTKQYLDRAIKLNPEQVEVKLEEAKYIYQCNLDYNQALRIMGKLKSKYPMNPEIYYWMGSIYKRMGDYNKSIELHKQAIKLDPLKPAYWSDLSYALRWNGCYHEAEQCCKKAIDLNPLENLYYWNLIDLCYLEGNMDKLNKLLNNPDFPLEPVSKKNQIALMRGDLETSIEIIKDFRQYIKNKMVDFYYRDLVLGLEYYLISNEKMSTIHFEAERIFLEEKLKESINDDRIYRSLGIVYAGLGNKSKAIEYGKKAIEIHGMESDELNMARILMMVGEYDEGIAHLENLLEHTKVISIEYLKNFYIWKAFHNNEKFKQLLSNPKYQVNQFNQ